MFSSWLVLASSSAVAMVVERVPLLSAMAQVGSWPPVGCWLLVVSPVWGYATYCAALRL